MKTFLKFNFQILAVSHYDITPRSWIYQKLSKPPKRKKSMILIIKPVLALMPIPVLIPIET